MLNELANTTILGIIQGLTEWLPVSSTGHLKIAEHYLGLTTTPLFNLFLHLGTLIVVVLYFRHEVVDILSALVILDFKSESGKTILPIVIASIPTGAIGLLYVLFLEDILNAILPIAFTFLIGATAVYASKHGRDRRENITITIAFVIGIMQGLAVFPGLSRSGITISTALLLGLTREKTFKFSFILSIPAILGALIVEYIKHSGQLSASGIGWTEMLAGVISAMMIGYIALKVVQKAVMSKKFHYFAFYTWPLGVVLVILTLLSF